MAQHLITCPACKGLGLINPTEIEPLTPIQNMSLRAVFMNHNIWPNVPPGKDPDVDYLARQGMIRWTGKGYEITDAGQAALERSEG